MTGAPVPSGVSALIERAQRCLANGFRPVPVLGPSVPVLVERDGRTVRQAPGKQPHRALWARKDREVYGATARSVAGWASLRDIADHPNLGLACGSAVAADIDVYEAGLADAIEALAVETLGGTPLRRVGQPPKRLLVYRAAGGPLRKAQTPELSKGELKAKVEVLGHGQQFVAHGIHPVTRQPYAWGDATPETTPLTELPAVTQAQAAALVAEAERMLRAAGYRTKAEIEGTAAPGVGPRPNGHARDDADDEFRAVNGAALADLGSWVPELFPSARFQPGTGAYRVSSRDLGRDLEEDLSLAPTGVVDFGIADRGDPRQGRRTPIDVVMEHGGAANPLEAARWLAERLGTPFVGFVGARGQGFPESRDGPPKGEDPLVGSAGDKGQGNREGGEPWPDPEPLGAELPPVAPFDLLLLPSSLRPWVADVAQRMQAPLEFVAVPALVAAGSLIGRKVGIRPRRADDWLVVPNLWGAIVGRPGQLKTPAAQAGLDPLHRLEREAAGRFKDETRWAEAEKAVGDALRKAREKDLAEKIKSKAKRESMVAWLAEIEDPPAPARRRYLINDSTVEKLGELLRDNPTGLLCYRDELTGWLRSMEREGHEADRSFFLEAWNGTGSYTFDRIGRGTVEIEHAIVSVCGGIQPGPLLAYLGAIRRGGVGDDGLLQRLQLIVWPDPRPSWEDMDLPPDTGARTKAFEAFAALDGLDAAAFGATVPVGAGIPFVRFDAAAQERFVAWRAGLEGRLLSAELPAAVEAHLAKYRSLVPSLALIFQALDHGRGPVRDEALVRALAWAAYLEGHARRVYHVLFHGDRTAAALLGRRLRAGALADGFTLRDVQRKDWASLTDREAIQAGLALLEECGWIRSRVEGTGGRPRRTYTINPKLEEGAP